VAVPTALLVNATLVGERSAEADPLAALAVMFPPLPQDEHIKAVRTQIKPSMMKVFRFDSCNPGLAIQGTSAFPGP
jgi:hypothetical protein